jgi:8-oxo-dGTP pyrophosphatase MutT (NUDIX family)
MKKFFGKYILSYAHKLIKVYWFFRRPNVSGSKVLVVHDGKMLLIRQNYGNKELWNLPGGGHKKGESYEETAIRETFEEVGVRPTSVFFLGDEHVKEDYLNVHIHYYVFEVSGSEFVIDQLEINEARWFKISEGKKENYHMYTNRVIDLYDKHKNS